MTRSASRPGVALTAALMALLAGGGANAVADATDDYPIPNRILNTTCTAEQIMAAVRDVRPVYYERYMIDYNNHAPEVQQAARDYAHWFFALNPTERREWSERMASDIYSDPLVFQWPNHAKLFFNNKGVAARATEVCQQYPPDDMGVWRW